MSENKRSPLPQIPADWDTINNPAKGLHTRTYSYFQFDEASSALQKAVRRGHGEEAIQWVLEMALSGPLCRTNAWNRLLVMTFEDIGPACIGAFLHVHNAFTQAPDDDYILAAAAQYVASVKKTRVNDWACHIFSELHGKEEADKVVVEMKEVKEVGRRFREALEKKDISECLRLSTVLYFTSHKLGKRNNAQKMVWDSFFGVIGDNDILLKEMWKLANSSNWRWKDKSRLIIAHTLVLYCNKVWPKMSADEVKRAQLAPSAALKEKVDKLKKHEGLVGVPDYALDKHTAEGRKMGRGLPHFMEMASSLNNREDNWANIDDYYKNYVWNKLKARGSEEGF